MLPCPHIIMTLLQLWCCAEKPHIEKNYIGETVEESMYVYQNPFSLTRPPPAFIPTPKNAEFMFFLFLFFSFFFGGGGQGSGDIVQWQLKITLSRTYKIPHQCSTQKEFKANTRQSHVVVFRLKWPDEGKTRSSEQLQDFSNSILLFWKQQVQLARLTHD